MANLRDVFHQQKLFFSSEKTRDLSFRLEQLAILKKMIIQNQQQIIAAIQRDFKKPEHEILSSEIGVVIDEIKLFQNKLQSWLKPIKRVTPLPFLFADSQIYLEPRGISLIISPWNYPFQLCFAPLVGAIAAGQCVMMKPSEVSSHTTKLIFELVSKTFSSDYIAVIEGGVSETTELLKLPFDHIFFTGSTEVGRIVQRAAAENLVPTVLELGGKSPAIVTQKADLDVAVQKLAWGKFFNAGQTCVAPDYVYVHSDIYDRFLNLFKDKLIQFYGAQPELSTSFARIINDRHFERLAELIAAEKVFYGGKTISKDRYIDPTLLKEVTWDDPVMKQEIFGPILPVMKFSSLTDLFNLLREKPKPLSAYFFSSCKKEQSAFLQKISFGGGVINDCIIHVGNSNLPFGGVGPSGMGNYHGYESLLAFSHQKSVMIKHKLFDFDLRYPPYTEKKMKWIKKILGF